MSRRGDCWDNAVAESFFGTLKMELLYELPLQTRTATRSGVTDYIEAFYNVRRRHSSLDYQSPVEFELKNGAHGGSAPVPPFVNEKERGPESPGLTV
jgi:transposase InsO family protein